MQEDTEMEEKMLMVHALEERDLLVKRIFDGIRTSRFVGLGRKKDDKVLGGIVSKAEFSRKAENSFRELLELMDRYQLLDGAIAASNAVTCVETSFGRFSVAQAISIQSRLCGGSVYEEDAEFERNLCRKIEKEHRLCLQTREEENRNLQSDARQMRLSILKRDNREAEERSLEYVEEFVRQNEVELLDPLDILQKAEDMLDRRHSLLSELEEQIKISNANTYITVRGPEEGLRTA